MNDHGKGPADGDAQLCLKYSALHVAGREVVVIVESDLPDPHHAGMAAQLLDPGQGAVVGVFCVVWMHPDAGIDGRVTLCELDSAPRIVERGAGIDDRGDPGVQGPPDDLLPVSIELRRGEVRMRIDERDQSLASSVSVNPRGGARLPMSST